MRDSELIGFWNFEGDGPNVVDQSGNGGAGLLVNASLREGREGQAVFLTGQDDSHVTIPDYPALNRLQDHLTVAAWVFPFEQPQGYKVVVSRQVGELLHPDQFYLGFGPREGQMHYKWHLGTRDGDSYPEGDIYQGTPDVGRWIHLAGTYDGSEIVLFVDGNEIGRQSLRGMIRLDDNPITFGGEENGSQPRRVDGEFHGLIDEVRIYSSALSRGEVQALAGGGVPV